MENYILVTGASSGIGDHAVGLYIQHGYGVLAGVRSAADAERLKVKYGAAVFPMILDVTREEEVIQAVSAAAEIIDNGNLVAIVNNAGIVVSGAVLYIPTEAWQQQFEVNLIGQIRVTQRFFPLLIRNHSSSLHPRRIINMSSVSGLFASPFMGPYSASKFALEAMSDSLRRELYMYDVQVVLIEPGNIRTPIWTKAKSSPSYFGREHDSIVAFKEKIIDQNIEQGMELQIMDNALLNAVRNKKVKPRYLVVPSKWKFMLIRSLPARMVDRMIRKRLTRSQVRPF